MNGTIFSVCSISAFSAQFAAPKRCQKECNKEQEKRELCQSRTDVEPVLAYCGKVSYSAELECTKSPRDTQSTQSARFESHTTKCRETCRWRFKANAASSSQVYLTDAKMNERARKLAAAGTNQDPSFQERARKLVGENSHINDENDSKWPHNYHISRANVSHLEIVCSNLRQQLKRKPEDEIDHLDVNTLIWRMFMIVTQQAAVHLGNDFLENLHSTTNLPQRTVKQLFDVTSKLVREQTEIQGTSLVDWQEDSWKRTTLLTDRTVRLSTAKAYVFSDSVYCA